MGRKSIMILTKDMRELTAVFEKHAVEYALVGGGAVIYYGYTRTTQDIDFLVNPSESNLPKVLSALEEFGFPPTEQLEEFFSTTGNALHLGIEPNRIDLLTSLAGIENEQIFENVEKVELGEWTVSIISLSDLLKSKRSTGRLKDLADVEELEKIQNDSIQ